MHVDDLADSIFMIPSFERLSDLKYNIYKNNISL